MLGEKIGDSVGYRVRFDTRISANTSVVASAVKRAMRLHEGNILAFLPGQAEILKCHELLDDTIQDAEILPLYGMLPPEKQQQVLSPNNDVDCFGLG